jgi:uncharacterized membrane protein
MRSVILVVATFLACAVEMVEALTIVLAAAFSRGWHSVRLGIGAALLALAVVVALLGPALTLLPLETLRVVVGFLLLTLGLQWLRKALLRAAGYIPLHDEDRIFEREMQEAALADGTAPSSRFDGYAFTLSFKGVFLEGLEVAFIVVTVGAAHDGFLLPIIGAVAAVIAVAIAGVIVHRPLSRVPENTMKLIVGVMLTTFGTFWGAEGAGVHWPGSDWMILGVLAFYTALSFALVEALNRRGHKPAAAAGAGA